MTKDLIFGKVPPQAIDIERAILGAITLEKNAFDTAAEILQPECFYLDAHQRIYRAMTGLYADNQPIDLFTLIDALKKAGDLEKIGGVIAVTKLQDQVVSAANLVTHCRIVYQKFLSRELIRIGGEIIGDAYQEESDPFDLLEVLEREVSGLAVRQQGNKFRTLAEVAGESVKRIYEAKVSGNELTGVTSGLPEIDALTQGWQRTNFIILAARPGVGKSAVAGNLAMNAANAGTGTAIFSLEMSAGQWADRMLAGSTHIALHNLKRGRVDDQEMERLQKTALVDYQKTPIFIDDSPNLTIYQLKRKARSLVLKRAVGLILVDYLQLMDGSRRPGENREQEVARISRELKQLAKELNIPIIALSQLSRQADGAEPRLGMLRESGAIEQDADDVFFLDPVDEAAAASDASLQDSIMFIIAKHRNGVLSKLPLKFVKPIQKLMTEREYERYLTGRNGSWRQVNVDF